MCTHVKWRREGERTWGKWDGYVEASASREMRGIAQRDRQDEEPVLVRYLGREER